MINSKGSVVVGEEGSDWVLAELLVVPDDCGEGEEALEDSGDDTAPGASAVAFEVELAFEGGPPRVFRTAISGWFMLLVEDLVARS